MAGLACDGGAIGIPLPLGDALATLANRLDDAAFVHWTPAELTRYLIEALRTTSAMTQRWRNRGSFAGTVNQPFYDLSVVLPSLRGFTVTDRDLVTDLEYALMEAPTPTVWTGTEQFNLPLLVGAIASRTQQFLMDTGVTLTRSLTSLTPDSAGRITLPSDILDIRRAAWLMSGGSDTGSVVPLSREDEWAITHYIPTASPIDPSKTWPTGYSVGVTPPLTVQLAPAPLTAGTLDLLAVQTALALDPTSGVILPVPSDWTWVIKWGALADILSRDGLGSDPQRAAYCEARYQQGVTLAKAASVVLQAAINGSTVLLKGLAETDRYRRTWQTTAGAPTSVLQTGQNLVGLNPKPDGLATYTVTLDLVVNVLVPVDLTDCLQIDEGMRDAFFDYAQHLATFKEGPGQLQQAMGLYERFARACGVPVALNQADVPNRGPIFQQQVQDERMTPREQATEATT